MLKVTWITAQFQDTVLSLCIVMSLFLAITRNTWHRIRHGLQRTHSFLVTFAFAHRSSQLAPASHITNSKEESGTIPTKHSSLPLLLGRDHLELSTTLLLRRVDVRRTLLRNLRPTTASSTCTLGIRSATNTHHRLGSSRRFHDTLISEFSATDKFFGEAAAIKGL